MATVPQYQVSLLPYFPISNADFTVNRIHFFNLAAFKDKYIASNSLRKRIEQYCALYMDENLKPLSSPTLAVIDSDYSFGPVTDPLLLDVQRYALALLVCSIGEEQERCISEQFTLFHQPFNLTEDAIAYPTGSLYHQTNWRSITTTHLVRPAYVPDEVINYRWERILMEGLANMIDAHDAADARIFEALRWVQYAFMNADGISHVSRVVMMATVFEILFALPWRGKEDSFANQLEALLGVGSMGHPQIAKPNALGKPRTNTMYGWWARDFYSLRSKIVHEGVVSSGDLVNAKRALHLSLALKMLKFCLYRLLEQRGLIVFQTLQGACFGELEGLSPEKCDAENRLRKIENLIS